MIAALALAATFNLLCTGTRTTHEDREPPRIEPFSETYRIDLAAGRWCKGACKETTAIRSHDAKSILLEDFSPTNLFTHIDRETGAIYRTARLTVSEEGFCEPRPFSGFPPRRF